jgi:hypothetical protein
VAAARRHLVDQGLYRRITLNATSLHWNTCLTSACSSDRDRQYAIILFNFYSHNRFIEEIKG